MMARRRCANRIATTVIEDRPASLDCWRVVDRACFSGQWRGCSLWHTHMTMVSHVNALSQSARFISDTLAKSGDSSTAFVTSRVDLNNALLAGLPDDTVAKLHKCQNIAARVVTRTRIRDHINPVLMKLHWLPVEQRIQYKLLIQVYNALNGLVPEYITDLLQAYVPTRALRSAGTNYCLSQRQPLGGAFELAARQLRSYGTLCQQPYKLHHH